MSIPIVSPTKGHKYIKYHIYEYPLNSILIFSEVKVPYKLHSHKGSTTKIRHMIQITFNAEKTEKTEKR